MKETRILICLIIIAISHMFMAFDLGLRNLDQPNPIPIDPWTPSYVYNAINGPVFPPDYSTGLIIPDPQPLGLVDTFQACFTNPVVEHPPAPADAWIFEPGAYGMMDRWATERILIIVP